MTFAVMLALLMAIAILGVSKLNELNSAITQVISGPVARLDRAESLNERISFALRMEKNLALTNDMELMQKFDGELMQARSDMKSLIAAVLANATDSTRPIWVDIDNSYTAWLPVNDMIRRLGLANNNAEAGVLSMTKSRELAGKISRATTQLVGSSKADMDEANKATDTMYDSARTMMIVMAGLALVVALAGAIWIGWIVAQGLKKASVVIAAVAIGDIEQEVTVATNDEIKDLVDTVNRMTTNLRQTARLADTIATGDLSVDHQPLSDKDVLGHALVRMTANLRTSAQLADTIADGDLRVDHTPLSDKDILGLALIRMTSNLRASAQLADAIASGVLASITRRCPTGICSVWR
ncbi:HAMP domain-containing protein [Granulibacter bethesdensis]|nr:HAMP domain-containing protein [Granulibacter bethesdensis]